jgi:hypothetical protein
MIGTVLSPDEAAQQLLGLAQNSQLCVGVDSVCFPPTATVQPRSSDAPRGSESSSGNSMAVVGAAAGGGLLLILLVLLILLLVSRRRKQRQQVSENKSDLRSVKAFINPLYTTHEGFRNARIGNSSFRDASTIEPSVVHNPLFNETNVDDE